MKKKIKKNLVSETSSSRKRKVKKNILIRPRKKAYYTEIFMFEGENYHQKM